jgi:DNA-binding NtrC family response regulator
MERSGAPSEAPVQGDPTERDATLLLGALTTALSALGRTDLDRALQESFGEAQHGLRARKGLLLVVRGLDPVAFEILYSSGLDAEEQEACRRMRSLRGVSPSVIRRVIEQGRPVFIPNAQVGSGSLDRTASLLEGPQSVLCTPIIDPHTGTPLAVLYFQNEGLLDAFQEQDASWLWAYALALGEGVGLRLQERRRLEESDAVGARLAEPIPGAPELVGDSEEMRRLRQVLHEVLIPAADLSSPKPILVLGPRGTGKDLVARYLHAYAARRRLGRFVSFNCAGLRGDLAEARVFGFVRGAFTGADRDNPGLFREADGGVLFLDEIAQMPLEGQALLLRAIESRRVQPVGAAREFPVDVQLVSATNKDLRIEVATGRFLPDLYDRIRALPLELKPLASPTRRADIRVLLSHFLGVHERAHRKRTLGLTREASLALLNYSWPGNVRELDNLCAALIAYARGGQEITLADVQRHAPEILDPENRQADAGVLGDDGGTYEEAFVSWERELLKRRIEHHGGHHTRTMKSLGLPRATYYRVLKRCGLRSPEGPADE